MSLETGLNALLQGNRKLLESFSGLSGVLRDKPAGNEVALLDIFSDSVEEIIGLAEETLLFLEGSKTVSVDASHISELLVKCQLLYTSTLANILELNSYERLRELRHFSHNRGGEWPGWAKEVRTCLKTCLQATYQFNQIIFDCCQENLARNNIYYILTDASPGNTGSTDQTK